MRIWMEEYREKSVVFEDGFRAALFANLVADAPDSGSRLFDKLDAVQQVGDEGIAADALAAEVCERHSLGQTAGADHFDPVRIKFDKYVGPFNKPVAMHHCVGDRFTKGLHRVLGNILALQTLDAPCGAGVALDEPHGVLDVGYYPAVEVLAIENMDFVRALGEKAGDVSLVEKVPHVFGEEQHPRIAKEELAARTLGRLNVDQHIFSARPASDTAEFEPSIEFVLVEILRKAKPGVDGKIETDHSFGSEKIPDFVTRELLSRGIAPAWHYFRARLRL